MSERPTAVTVHYIINVTEDVFESFALFWCLFLWEFIVRYCHRHTRHLAIRADAGIRMVYWFKSSFGAKAKTYRPTSASNWCFAIALRFVSGIRMCVVLWCVSACFVCLLYLFVYSSFWSSLFRISDITIYVNLLDFFFIHILSICFDIDAIHLIRRSLKERHRKKRDMAWVWIFAFWQENFQTVISASKINSLFWWRCFDKKCERRWVRQTRFTF